MHKISKNTILYDEDDGGDDGGDDGDDDGECMMCGQETLTISMHKSK